MVLATRQLTLDEFLELSEEKPALEFEEGTVTQKVSPKGQHSELQYSICEILNTFSKPTRLARAYPELRVTFGGRSYVPDVSLYRWERIPVDAQGEIVNDFTEAPDLVVEIVSPEQSTNALVRRCLWYVAHGVGIALLVDPSDRSVIFFRPGSAPIGLSGEDRIDLYGAGAIGSTMGAYLRLAGVETILVARRRHRRVTVRRDSALVSRFWRPGGSSISVARDLSDPPRRSSRS